MSVKKNKNEDGFVIIFVALLLLIMILMVVVFIPRQQPSASDGTATDSGEVGSDLGYTSGMVVAPVGCTIFSGQGCLGANTPEFDRKNTFVAQQLGIPDPNILKAIYRAESVILCNPGWFDHKRGVWGAAGIIQFIPSTASSMFKVSNSIFITMPAVRQLDYAYRYLKGSGCGTGRCKSLLDTYLVIHAPVSCRFKDVSHICYSDGSAAYKNGGNRKLDNNPHDGHVTNLEIGAFAFKAYKEGAKKCR